MKYACEHIVSPPFFVTRIILSVFIRPPSAPAVFGFARLQAYSFNSCGLHDTCSVLNLHGMPGLIGGAVSGANTERSDDEIIAAFKNRIYLTIIHSL